MYRTLRTAARPPAIARWPRQAPLSRLTGATPTKRRDSPAVEVPELGQLGDQGAGGDLANARHRGQQILGRAPSGGAAHLVFDLLVELGERRLQGGERALEAAQDLGATRLAPAVALHADHLDDLAAPGDQLGQDLGLLVEHRPRFGPHLLGEARDQVGVKPVGLGQTADRARVGWAKD